MPRRPMEMGTWGAINTKQVEKGVWRAYTRCRDLDGATRQVSASGTSKGSAEANLKSRLKTRFIALDGDVKPQTTIAVLGDVWLAGIKANGLLEESSIETYERTVKTIKAGFGQVRVVEATVPSVTRFVRSVHTKSPSQAHHVRTVLGRMLSLATAQGAIAANPVRSLDKMSRGSRKEVLTLSVEDIAVLRAEVLAWQTEKRPGPKDADLGDIVEMLIATGCRSGEVLAVRWGDLDFERGTVTISGTLRYRKGKGNGGVYRKPKPKTDSSYRTLLLPEFALEMLRNRVERVDADPEAPVFPARGGGWKHPHNVRRQWRKVRDRAGYAWVIPHTFRKTVASAVDAELDLHAASAVLGHASEQVTKDHYVAKAALAPDVRSVLDAFAPQDDPAA